MNEKINNVLDNINKVMIGKDDVVILCLVGLLAQGHILIEDVPGVGKTMLVRTLAKSLDCDFKRIQFTPDLLPSDITGVSIYNQQTMAFEFRKGPIFGNIVLGDEINRTSPKTQSSLLEAMEEKSVTVDGQTFQLEQPFFVMATQNPIEYEGTYPLPEAQLDRFILKVKLGYPQFEEELEMLNRTSERHPIESITAVMSQAELIESQEAAARIHVAEPVKRYILHIVTETRRHEAVYLGGSPRAAIAMMQAAKAYAYIHGRSFVIPDDVKYLAPFILGHRIILTSEATYHGLTADAVVASIIEHVAVPLRKEYS